MGGQGFLVVRVNEEPCLLGNAVQLIMTSTWQEMKDAWDNGIPPILLIENEYGSNTEFIGLYYDDVNLVYEANTNIALFETSDPNDYPVNGNCGGIINPL